METENIILTKQHRGSKNGTSFMGRRDGELVRESIKLDKKDNEKDKVFHVVIPEDTTSFNPSFYLGLFYKSIKKLKWEDFKKTYVFDFSNFTDESLKQIIKENIDECERKAKNVLNGVTGLDL